MLVRYVYFIKNLKIQKLFPDSSSRNIVFICPQIIHINYMSILITVKPQ